ncbi:eukaryotic translation initiation factor 5B-like isoform X2 [Gordionus sp. m RMFG-2023]|uniref:eukaryotic translation initiation factor 5B-like isoform X2 n=1 Tax=Gordionus sp. m RMFG-2023 TaxID=3053472 RepID=UPI0031FE17A5
MASIFEIDPELEKEYFKEYESDENEKKMKKSKKPKKLKNTIIKNNIDSSGILDKGHEDAAIKDKDKKPKKKAKKDDKKESSKKADAGDKKKLNKAQLTILKEALRKKEQEETQFIQQEEERVRREEEAEEKRLEKIHLEEERKLKKRQKEKERKDRLKQEGKLLTKAQKQSKMRAEAMLQALREQGIELPATKTSNTDFANDQVIKPKRIIYVDKKRSKKNLTLLVSSKVLNPNAVESNNIQDESGDPSPPPKEDYLQHSGSSDEGGDLDESDLEDIKGEWDASSAISTSDSDSLSNASSFTDLHLEPENVENYQVSLDTDNHILTTTIETHHKIPQQSLEEKVRSRIEARRVKAELEITLENLRAPVICIMGHVDTGKTKILDNLRKTHVQENEAGGITQQIGATNVPKQAIIEQIKFVKGFCEADLKIPGLLIIDTPGHESFKNLRNRGSSLCNIGILVVDIMHGMEPQTLESLKTMLDKKIPFVIALNKIDRLHQWKSYPQADIEDTLKRQAPNVSMEFNDRLKSITVQFAEQCVNVALFYANPDPTEFVSMIPTSAHTGEGMGNLIYSLTQLAHGQIVEHLRFSPDLLECSVLEVKELLGMGTTLDVILVNGCLKEGDNLVLAGFDGAICTQVRGLLMPQPLKDLRVKNQYEKYKVVNAAMGVKVIGKDLENALPGFPIFLAHNHDEIEFLKQDMNALIEDTLQSIKLSEIGVYVQASTIGSLEALLEFLKISKIPYAGINIGPVHKKDVMRAAAMLDHNVQYAAILAFDIKIDKDAQEMADSLRIKIFSADIIYHLFDEFTRFQEEYRRSQKDKHKDSVVFPCKLVILPQFIFKTRDPIIVGVNVVAGELRIGTPLCVPSKEALYIGNVSSIEFNHKNMDAAKKGQEVCIKIDNPSGETPKLYGRHFDHEDALISRINRNSIDTLKEYYRDEMQKSDWQLVVELKKLLQII